MPNTIHKRDRNIVNNVYKCLLQKKHAGCEYISLNDVTKLISELTGLMKEMLKSAILLCSGAHVPGISGIFTTCRQQQIAEELGFQKYHEIYYDKYKIEDELVFVETGAGNYSAALMAYRIPAVEEILEVESQHSSRFNIQTIEDGQQGE